LILVFVSGEMQWVIESLLAKLAEDFITKSCIRGNPSTSAETHSIKVLPLQTPVDAKQLVRFYREAHITVDLKHRNIVRVFDVGQVSRHCLLCNAICCAF
jgi:serine/threonine protein kinase